MASLELRNGKYRVVFRYGGQKFSRTLKTQDAREAKHALARLEDNLRRLELGTLSIDPAADILCVLLSSGAMNNRQRVSKPPLLGPLLDQYFSSLPEGSLENSTCKMLKTHIGHLKRLLGVRLRTSSLGLLEIQQYINNRGKEPGLRGHQISPVTIRKELATLTTIWSWASELGLISHPLPKKSRLRFPKRNEKPTFRTWVEIERIIERGCLSDEEAREYWDCVYLNQAQIAELLRVVAAKRHYACVLPMFATAAYTGSRRSELMRSQIEDIDLDSDVFVIREKKRIRGQRSTRSVPISPQLKVYLTEWFDRHPGGHFTFCDHGEPLTRDQAHNHFKSTLAKSKWSVLRGWHVLRHSFISNCASHGVDQRMIDDWVGHQTEAMRRRYRHLFPTQQQQAIASVFAFKAQT